MTSYYEAVIQETGAKLKITYRNGKFLKLEKISGKMTQQHFEYIGRLLPPEEKDVSAFAKARSPKITYQKIEKVKSIFTQFNDQWFLLYESIMDIAPKFTAGDGKALKSIIKYLTEVAGTQTAALELWQVVMNHWTQLDEFHQKNLDLKYINSQLNKILQNVKRINTSGAKGISSSYLSKVMDDLQS
jgi:hypothetical protein